MANDGTVKIGVEFDQQDINKEFRKLEKEAGKIKSALNSIDEALKLNPQNLELITAKQKLLTAAIESSKKQVALLTEEMERGRADKAVERNTTAYQNFGAALRDAQEELSQYSSQLEDVDNQLASVSDQLRSTEKAVERSSDSISDLSADFQNVKSSADNFEQQLRDVSEAARGATDDLGGVGSAAGGVSGGFTVAKGAAATFAGNALTMVLEGAIQAAEALWDLDEATEEYRESMGLLNTAFETAGFNPETAAEAYRGFYEILGETDQATEASQLLSQLAQSEEDVAKWTKIAAGVYGTFGESIPIESLMEAANEAVKTGEVTGALADALDWAGISSEEVGNQLALLADETDRAQYLMGILGHQYSDAADSFYENNEAIIAARGAQTELDESLGLLGESVANLKTKLVETFGPYLADLAEIGAGGIDLLTDGVVALGDAFDWLGGKIGDVIQWFQNLFGTASQASAPASHSTSRTSKVSAMSISPQSIVGPVASSAGGGGMADGLSSSLASASERISWESILPNLEQRVIAATNAMVPASAQYLGPEMWSGKSHSPQRGNDGIQHLKVEFEIKPRELSRFITPYINEEMARMGPDMIG